jgi:hypothetical protein
VLTPKNGSAPCDCVGTKLPDAGGGRGGPGWCLGRVAGRRCSRCWDAARIRERVVELVESAPYEFEHAVDTCGVVVADANVDDEHLGGAMLGRPGPATDRLSCAQFATTRTGDRAACVIAAAADTVSDMAHSLRALVAATVMFGTACGGAIANQTETSFESSATAPEDVAEAATGTPPSPSPGDDVPVDGETQVDGEDQVDGQAQVDGEVLAAGASPAEGADVVEVVVDGHRTGDLVSVAFSNPPSTDDRVPLNAALVSAGRIRGTAAVELDAPQYLTFPSGSDRHSALAVALSHLEVLAGGPLVSGVRVGAIGSVSSDAMTSDMMGPSLLDAALTTLKSSGAQVIFSPAFPDGVPVVHHRQDVIQNRDGGIDRNLAVAGPLKLAEYVESGRAAASTTDVVAVKVSDLRQAVAFLCGYQSQPTACELTATMAEHTIAQARPSLFGKDGMSPPPELHQRLGPR